MVRVVAKKRTIPPCAGTTRGSSKYLALTQIFTLPRLEETGHFPHDRPSIKNLLVVSLNSGSLKYQGFSDNDLSYIEWTGEQESCIVTLSRSGEGRN